MSYEKRGFGSFGLVLLAAFGLMAFTAAAAQAAGDWYESSSEITSNKKFSGELSTEPEMIILVPKKNAEFKCAKFKMSDGVLLPLSGGKGPEGGSLAHAKWLFSECKFYLTSPTLEWAKNCTVSISEASILLEVVGAGIILLRPSVSKLGSITLGELCPILAEETIELTGTLLLVSAVLKAKRHLLSFSQDAIHEWQFGTSLAIIDGSFFAELESTNEWGIG